MAPIFDQSFPPGPRGGTLPPLLAATTRPGPGCAPSRMAALQVILAIVVRLPPAHCSSKILPASCCCNQCWSRLQCTCQWDLVCSTDDSRLAGFGSGFIFSPSSDSDRFRHAGFGFGSVSALAVRIGSGTASFGFGLASAGSDSDRRPIRFGFGIRTRGFRLRQRGVCRT